MAPHPKDQKPTVELICPVGEHPFTVPYQLRNQRRFCSKQHANVYHGAHRGDAPEGFSTVAMLASRYGYSRDHITRLIAAGTIRAEWRNGHYLISAAAAAAAHHHGVFVRGKHDKAGIPLAQVKSRRGRFVFDDEGATQ